MPLRPNVLFSTFLPLPPSASLPRQVIKLRSEASGTVPDQGVSPLNWLFTPLEARAYSVQVPVLLGDNSVELLTLQVRQDRGCTEHRDRGGFWSHQSGQGPGC